jgi:ech hydrogenase subunit D
MIPNIVVVESDKIQEEANNMKLYGYRFMAMTCDQIGDKLELTYHFAMEFEIKNLRTVVEPKATVKSISHIYPAALLIENEFQDLYGLHFSDLLIDYKGRLYLATNAPETPMMKEIKL